MLEKETKKTAFQSSPSYYPSTLLSITDFSIHCFVSVILFLDGSVSAWDTSMERVEIKWDFLPRGYISTMNITTVFLKGLL